MAKCDQLTPLPFKGLMLCSSVAVHGVVGVRVFCLMVEILLCRISWVEWASIRHVPVVESEGYWGHKGSHWEKSSQEGGQYECHHTLLLHANSLHNAVVTCEIKLFQLSSTSVWNNFISMHGNLAGIIPKSFHRLIAAHIYFPPFSLSLK